MGVAGVRLALIAKPEEGEVVGVGLEAVCLAEDFVQGSKLGLWDLDRLAAVFTHEVLVVVVQCDVPCPRLTVSQWDVVDQPDPGKFLERSVNGRGIYLPCVCRNSIDDHLSAHERLVAGCQRTNDGSSRESHAQSGGPDSLDEQVFGQHDVGRHGNSLPFAAASQAMLRLVVIRAACNSGRRAVVGLFGLD